MSLSSQNKTKKHTKPRENKIIKKKGFAKIKNIQPILTPIKTLQTKKPDIKTHCLKSIVKETQSYHQYESKLDMRETKTKQRYKETKRRRGETERA